MKELLKCSPNKGLDKHNTTTKVSFLYNYSLKCQQSMWYIVRILCAPSKMLKRYMHYAEINSLPGV